MTNQEYVSKLQELSRLYHSRTGPSKWHDQIAARQAEVIKIRLSHVTGIPNETKQTLVRTKKKLKRTK